MFTYRKSHANFERNFHLSGLSIAHASKDMTATFSELLLYIKGLKASPNEYLGGRTAQYSIPDMLTRGAGIIELEAKQQSHRQGLEEESIGNGNLDERSEEMRESSTEDINAEDLAVDGPL